MAPVPPPPTIGVFDSGFGGLTVLRALLPLQTYANYIYLGDTARLPYGSKSRETIARYAVSSAKFLQDQGANLLVIACNTATALALEDIRQAVPIPVIGVVEPGAKAASAASAASAANKNGSVILSAAPERAAGESNGAESKDLRLSSARRETTPSPPVLVLATQATVESHAYKRALATLNLEAHEKACPL